MWMMGWFAGGCGASSQDAPHWVSVLPPLVAILLAVFLRRVVWALGLGVWLGALIVAGFNPISASARMVDRWLVETLADRSHQTILLFTLLLGGMVGVVQRSGGSAGLAQMATRWARDRRRSLLATWLLGVVIFFDDYANALLVGSSMRPVTDRLRISREKLAFLVDATAAPVASVAVISSWIGVELGYIDDQLKAVGLKDNAYLLFLETLPYRFYPLLMLAFGWMVAWTGRDFGPMRRAEIRAANRPAPQDGDPEERAAPVRASWVFGAVPLGVLILTAVVGMYVDGTRAAVQAGIARPALRDVFSHANTTEALLWASLLAGLVAMAVIVARRSLSFSQAAAAWGAGLRSMLTACMILILAWMLGALCKELGTARWLVSAVGPWISVSLLPAGVFVIAAAVSFATGTSWGTMAILFPLVVPLAYSLAPDEHRVMVGAISSILAGSVWGDHCSPLSDTTIMSSVATGCDHMDHVRTQVPYALLVGGTAIVVGDLGTGFGWYPAPVALVLGIVVLMLTLRWVGRPVPPPADQETGPA